MALPTLTIQHSEDRLEVKDNPALYWEFYFSFIVGGLVALFVTFTATLSRTSLWIGIVVACVAIVAGLLLLAREAASIIVLNQSDATLTVTRWTLLKRSTATRPLRDVTAAKIERKDNVDTGSLLRPTLILTGGATLPISNFWYKKDEASRVVVDNVNAFVAALTTGKNVA